MKNKQILSDTNQMDDIAKKKEGNCFYCGLLEHHINDYKHKKKLKKEMEPRIKGQHNSIFYPYKCDSGK
jgi:hypothetical protein